MTPVVQCHISIFHDICVAFPVVYIGLKFQKPIHILSFWCAHKDVDELSVAFDPQTCPSSWKTELQSDNVIHPGEANGLHHESVGIHFWYLLSSYFVTNHRHGHGIKRTLSLRNFYGYSYELEFMQNVIKDKITTEAKAFKSMLIFVLSFKNPNLSFIKIPLKNLR